MRFTQPSASPAEQLRQELKLLKSGARQIYAAAQNKPLGEITDDHIALLENAITSYGRKTVL
jgi:hypothetical protein